MGVSPCAMDEAHSRIHQAGPQDDIVVAEALFNAEEGVHTIWPSGDTFASADSQKSFFQNRAFAIMLQAILSTLRTIEYAVSVCKVRHRSHSLACRCTCTQEVRSHCWGGPLLKNAEPFTKPRCDMSWRIKETPTIDFAAYAIFHIISSKFVRNGIPGGFCGSLPSSARC